MAAESIGNLVPTKIPGLIDDADIQAALRLYHYGDYDYDPLNTDPGDLVNPSMAYTITDLQDQIDGLDARAYTSSQAQTDEPVPGDYTPTGIPNGSIWLDTDGSIGSQPTSATAIYTVVAPTTNLTDGLIWIKKGTVPLELYVYDQLNAEWDQVV